MANNFSFDIVSEVNFMEVDNAINQAQKELAQRYDFKGSKSSIDYNKTDKKITLIGDDDFKLKALIDIVEGKFAKRGVPLKSMEFKAKEQAFEGTVRQVIELVSGLPSDKAKELTKMIKNEKFKVNTQIEGSKIKVTSVKKDELQAVIAFLKNAKFSLPLQFVNYR
ncbi:YajQ family cyclic di-GMP-binding protein [Candidatus Ruminimicrobium bovinum]|uniref:YajQ family cyclic di-GMP-binding protein n=1 Tax=Candidatus Ruminimicrobium bovinum TaxID=3242779 RepID=UPI0039B8754B